MWDYNTSLFYLHCFTSFRQFWCRLALRPHRTGTRANAPHGHILTLCVGVSFLTCSYTISILGTSYCSTLKMFDEWYTHWDPDSGNSIPKDHPNSHSLSWWIIIMHFRILFLTKTRYVSNCFFLLHENTYKSHLAFLCHNQVFLIRKIFNNHSLKNVLEKFGHTTL